MARAEKTNSAPPAPRTTVERQPVLSATGTSGRLPGAGTVGHPRLLIHARVGAALQILKVEMGGDGNSTSGSESSIETTKGVVDCNTS
jgi:hypothetical protein